MERAQILLIALIIFGFVSLNSSLHAEYRKEPLLITSSIVIDRDLEFDTTGFVVKGNGIVIDLGGRAIIFNNGNACEALNREFEQWSDNTPTSWTVTSGTTSSVPSTYFGNFDLNFSASGAIRSSPITIKLGKTYIAFAFVKGPSDGSATLRIRRASDNTILAEKTLSGSVLGRGYASAGTAEDDLRYKPSADISVILELVCTGNSAFRVGMVDIKPAFDYGVTSHRYQNISYFPDLPSTWFGESNDVTIKNGKLVQGNGQGVRSGGIRFPGKNWKIENVTIEMNGINTDGILGSYPESASILSTTIRSTSVSVFNRMHGTGGIKLDYPTGATVVSNNLIDGVPQMGMWIYGCIQNPDTTSLQITGNTIKQRELVTEGYALGLSGICNFTVAGNTFQPYQGRGILFDSGSGCSSGDKGTLNGSIHDNQILNLNEFRNPEYDVNELECAGIRIRNWGSANQSHKNLKIYNNTISGFTDQQRAHKVYGINITATAPEDSIEIYNNEIAVTATGLGRSASAIAFQDSNLTKGNSVRIYNNTLASNAAVLQFGGNDGANANGLLLEGNTFRRLSSPAAIGKPFAFGAWTGEQKFNILAGNLPETSDVDPLQAANILFDGPSSKGIIIGRHLVEVQVRGGNGLPFPNATVILKDKTGSTLHQDMTGANGKVVLYSPRIYYSGVGTSITAKEYPDGDTFEITATVANASPKYVNLAVSNDQLVTIVFEGVNPPSSPLGPAAPKNIRIGG